MTRKAHLSLKMLKETMWRNRKNLIWVIHDKQNQLKYFEKKDVLRLKKMDVF